MKLFCAIHGNEIEVGCALCRQCLETYRRHLALTRFDVWCANLKGWRLWAFAFAAFLLMIFVLWACGMLLGGTGNPENSDDADNRTFHAVNRASTGFGGKVAHCTGNAGMRPVATGLLCRRGIEGRA